MGKKRYDSSSGMSYGGGGMKTKAKGSMPMATDTKTGVKESYKSCANVTESRLNAGGDKAWKGKRGGKSAKSGSYSKYG